MAVDLPDFLKSGEHARLIPVAPGGQKERHASSVLLASLMVVAPFAREVLATLGRSIGTRGKVLAYTEVVFKKQPPGINCRPDGLLIIDTSRNQWRALIEAKIGNARIDPQQIAQYLQLARENDIDAVVSISNELTAIPEQTPYERPSGSNGRIKLFHWSWMKLVTLATLIAGGNEEIDQEQHYILKEMLRYFSHENIEVRGLHSMNSDWKALTSKVHAGASIHKNDIEVVNTVRAWHQEQHDICLLLSRKLTVPVTLRIKQSHRENQLTRTADDSAELADSKKLFASFDIPDVAGSIDVIADLLRRNVICQIEVAAPDDLKRYASRINWLLRQLPGSLPESVFIRINWKGGGETNATLGELRESVEVADIGRPGALPKAFQIVVVTDLGRYFSGTKSFIEGLERAVPDFYDQVARHIQPWQPKPPPGPASGIEENLAEMVEKLPAARRGSQGVLQSGKLNGRMFTIFEDGSIEVETSKGLKWFKDWSSLKSFADVSR